MPIKISDAKIKSVQEKRPDSKIIPPNSVKVTSWYKKGEINSWIKTVKDWDAMEDKIIFGDFVEDHSIEWASEKGQTPKGNKVWYLTEGIYFAKIYKDKDDEKGRIVFWAVTEKGKLIEISEDQAADLAAEANGKVFTPKPKEKHSSQKAEQEPEAEND